jgi:MFS family permease
MTAGRFFGWRVVGGAFVLAAFGWGIGFYGPPVFLQTLHETRGWPISVVSAAVTTHFLIGALFVANLPALHRRFGLPAITKAGAAALFLGICGWASAMSPWQLFAATLLSGAGWAAMGAAAINAIVSPWFVRKRPSALAAAYNGASIGGVVFSPLWVAAIGVAGFLPAALAIGCVSILTVWILTVRLFSKTPAGMNLAPDGDTQGIATTTARTEAKAKPGAMLWRDPKFITLAAGMAIGLFAQIGLLAHLFSLLVPALGRQYAGFAMGFATACAIGGRTIAGWLMPAHADRRLFACAGYAVQILGSLVFIAAETLASGSLNVVLLLIGVALFGSNIGNATSLPPLIAQTEFAKEDVQRVVALVVSIAQGTFAFAPAAFGIIRDLGTQQNATALFAAAAFVQVLAIGAFLLGRHR